MHSIRKVLLQERLCQLSDQCGVFDQGVVDLLDESARNSIGEKLRVAMITPRVQRLPTDK